MGGKLTAMAKRRTYKRDARGRFAGTGTTRIKRVGRKINRRRPRYVRGSVGTTVRVGRVGPGGEYAGIHVGAQLRRRKRRTATREVLAGAERVLADGRGRMVGVSTAVAGATIRRAR